VTLVDDRKTEIIKDFQVHDTDTGSADVQVAILTDRIRYLTEHLKIHPHDFLSRRGLMKLIGQRRRFLRYLARENTNRYQALLSKLGLRK